MKNLLIVFLSLSIIFILLSCDDKTKVKYIAKSSYDNLTSKYENIKRENQQLKRQNQKLKSQNETLKHDLKKYKNGFKSMYE